MIGVEARVFDRRGASHAIDLFEVHQKSADRLSLAGVLVQLASRTP